MEKMSIPEAAKYNMFEQAALLWACTNNCNCNACELLRKMAQTIVKLVQEAEK